MVQVTKGNDGKGRRHRLHQRLVAIFSFLTTLLLMALFWVPDPETGAAARHLSSSLRNRLKSIRDRVEKKMLGSGDLTKSREHAIRGGAGSMHGGGGGGGVSEEEMSDLQQILDGTLSLVDVRPSREATVHEDGSYTGVIGSFCAVDWSSHKNDPASTPMFRDVIASSPECRGDQIEMDLQTVMEAVSSFDEQNEQLIHMLELRGVVFHESRCGSTLVANILQAMYPEEHRVYSESPPPIGVLRAADYMGVEAAATILKDVIYLMSRSKDPKEKRVFFKIQSIGSTYMHVFEEAFPETPFIFVYRDPVQVMVSQLEHGVRSANCVRAQQHHPSRLVRALVQRRNIPYKVEDLDPEDLCAAHLAAITESAVEGLTNGQNPYGKAVNYRDLPDRLYQEIFPHEWDLTITPDALMRMQKVAGVYSKGRGNMAGKFEGDVEEKESEATTAMREAAQMFLFESYEILEKLSKE